MGLYFMHHSTQSLSSNLDVPSTSLPTNDLKWQQRMQSLSTAHPHQYLCIYIQFYINIMETLINMINITSVTLVTLMFSVIWRCIFFPLYFYNLQGRNESLLSKQGAVHFFPFQREFFHMILKKYPAGEYSTICYPFYSIQRFSFSINCSF